MFTIASIVEGEGELKSVPILIHRIKEIVAPGILLRTPNPIRVSRSLVVKPNEFEKYLNIAAQKAGRDGRILVLLDADDDCPRKLAADLRERVHASHSDRVVSVVLAKSEFESWFIASVESIAGKFSIQSDCKCPSNPERIRNAKGWLSRHMVQNAHYRPLAHQSKMSREFNMDIARKQSPSFDKFWRDIEALLLQY